jgi:hypothetical protein
VDPVAYETLYGQLIDACRSVVDSAEGEKPGYSEGLEGLVRPWMNPRTLAHTDREILEDLLARCRQVERELRGHRARSPCLTRIVKVSPVAVGMVGGLFLLRNPDVDLVPVIGLLRAWSDPIWLAARGSTELQRLGVVAAAVIVVSIRIVSRTARS